jgi:hypothetical protein
MTRKYANDAERKADWKAKRTVINLAEIRALWNFPINTMAAWAIEMAADKKGLLVREAREAEPGTKMKIDKDAAAMFEEMARKASTLARIFKNDPDLIWANTEF